jgi:hypothetical protein
MPTYFARISGATCTSFFLSSEALPTQCSTPWLLSLQTNSSAHETEQSSTFDRGNRCSPVLLAGVVQWLRRRWIQRNRQHAADGWPAVPADGWDGLRTRYLRAIEDAKRIVAESDSLADPLLPPGVQIAALARESHGSGILHAAVHSSHHLGQIITMRQLMGLWPPPSGTITW